MIRSGKFDEAIELLNGILGEDPTNLGALLNIGIAYTENGDNNSAIQALEYYVAQDPDNDEAWEALGCAHLRKDEHAAAERHLTRARELNPENASVLRNLSVLFSQTGRGRESFDLLKDSYRLNPDDYLTTYALATAYRYLGKYDDARRLFQRLDRFDYLPDQIHQEAQRNLLELAVGWN